LSDRSVPELIRNPQSSIKQRGTDGIERQSGRVEMRRIRCQQPLIVGADDPERQRIGEDERRIEQLMCGAP
jgi:hypothetical protein